METGEAAVGGLSGNKLYQQRARRALPILVRQARAHQPILYSEISAELGMSNPRTMNWPLGAIGNELLALGERWRTDIPPIQALVVNKSHGLPGEGLAWFAPDAAEYRQAPTGLRRKIVDKMLVRVYAYPHWERVLSEFGLEPLPPVVASIPALKSVFATGGVGEGKAHRELKNLVAQHPELVGLPHSVGRGETECMLHSADRVDVVFRTARRVVGVEVKPAGASEADITRGFFQCIKYDAVMRAEEAVSQTARDCSAVLALGGPLPSSLDALRLVLGVAVFDNLSA